MRVAYLDCSSGISGDMTLAALLDTGVSRSEIENAINSLGLPGVRLKVHQVTRGAFRAIKVDVEHPEQHAHRGLGEILTILERAQLSSRARDWATSMFHLIAEAESKVHGEPIEKIHFHEVGAIDSIVDIVAVAVGFDLLNVEQIFSSPIPTGRGEIRIAHGTCQVPAPGTAELLVGVPLQDVPVQAELTTPTGAAIIRTFVGQFGALPPMTIDAVGYGAGTKDFPGRANLLRILVGESSSTPETETIGVLETNLDQETPEVLGYVTQLLMDAGALDVTLTNVLMKKGRPGVVLTVLTKVSDLNRLESLIFQETGTLGIRRQVLERTTRRRTEYDLETPYGTIRGKLSWRSGEPPIFSPEFESLREIASTFHLPLREVYQIASAEYRQDPIDEVVEDHDPDSIPEDAHSHSHDHDHSHTHDHCHDHSHDHSHDHDHDHSHDHSHDHDHDREEQG